MLHFTTILQLCKLLNAINDIDFALLEMLFTCSGKDINVERIPKLREKFFNISIFRSNYTNFTREVNNQRVRTVPRPYLGKFFLCFTEKGGLMARSSVVRTFTFYGLMLYVLLLGSAQKHVYKKVRLSSLRQEWRLCCPKLFFSSTKF